MIAAITTMSKTSAETSAMDPRIREAELQSLKIKLEMLENELTLCDKQAEVIKSLYFEEIKRRWSQIRKAEEKTNSWLFDSSKTSFASWAESKEVSSIYYISGLVSSEFPTYRGFYFHQCAMLTLSCLPFQPGSGKSTLMKFASDHPKSQELLEKWARPYKLCKASYFFWNQGFEKQKSKTGLLQSLLYQILRHNPELATIADTVTGRQNYETWDFAELESMLDQVISSTKMNTRFCFFIDGLDEYGGEDEEISKILLSMIKSPHIKICASSRPSAVFENKLRSDSYSLKMQDLTKDDMREYVRNTLDELKRSKDLSGSEHEVESLTEQIAKHARGVWLWVFLVSRDLKKAVNRHEDLQKLKDIVNKLPQDLEKYFGRIISQIDSTYHDEMARMFLAAVEGVQPLPLLAFVLLNKELSHPGYATSATISSPALEELERTKKMQSLWTSRLRNRCGDLLVVEDGDHPTLFDCPVDFLHRTVRDFLQDCYHNNLKEKLNSNFNPSLSLCKVMLYFLKKHAGNKDSDLKDANSINSIFSVVDQFLYYAHEAEIHDQSTNSALITMLNEVDQVVRTIHARSRRAKFTGLMSTGNHWTCARDSPRPRGLDEYHEGGNCNYIALTVQARLVKYVRHKLAANPAQLHKPGRPLLDYALRPHRITPLTTPYHAPRDEPNICVELVELLLKAGADPNQTVYLNGDRSVWALFLISCAESTRREEVNEVSSDAWEWASELMIEHGAKPDCFGSRSDFDRVLRSIFGDDKADELMQKIREKEMERFSNSWTGWFYNKVIGRDQLGQY